jgi:hypothetical protein
LPHATLLDWSVAWAGIGPIVESDRATVNAVGILVMVDLLYSGGAVRGACAGIRSWPWLHTSGPALLSSESTGCM